MYESPAHLVFGFHACEREVGERILARRTSLRPSKNRYDWLGFGRYFWESNHGRARQYARWLSLRDSPPLLRNPFVTGAVIELGHCFNLLDSGHLKQLNDTYRSVRDSAQRSGFALPQNKPLVRGGDLIFRNLDCVVIEAVHQSREKKGLPSYDTVRAVFWEGEELYPNAGFRSHNHIQICVRNPNCIKGYFRPLRRIPQFAVPGGMGAPRE